MHILEILKRDHKTLQDLLIKMETTSLRARSSRRRLLFQLQDEFELHSLIKERILYPFLRRRFPTRMFGSTSEQRSIRLLVQELSDGRSKEQQWRVCLPALGRALREYISTEEHELEGSQDVLNAQHGEELGRRAEEERKSHVVEIF